MSFNWRFAATRLLPMFLIVILAAGISIAAVPSWRSAFNKFIARWSPRADEPTVTPTPLPTSSPTVTPTPTPSPTVSPTVFPTPTSSPTTTPTYTPSPTSSPTTSPTSSPTTSPTLTPPPLPPTPLPTVTPTSSPTPISAPTPSAEPTITPVNNEGNVDTGANAGGNASVLANNFQPDSKIEAYVNDKKVKVASLVSTGEGSYDVKLEIPEDTPLGKNLVKLIDNKGNIATTSINVDIAAKSNYPGIYIALAIVTGILLVYSIYNYLSGKKKY